MDGASNAPKAILFDWAGVFCSAGEPFAHPAFAAQTGLTVDDLASAVRDIYDQYYRGYISTETFWQTVIDRLQLTAVTPSELSEAYLKSYTLYPDALEFADSMRGAYKTALLSNLTAEMMFKIEDTHSVSSYFDHVLYSNEIGLMKPEPESFTKALEMLDCRAQEVLFIDDSLPNIEAAAQMGMQILQAQSPAQWQEELVRRTNTRS